MESVTACWRKSVQLSEQRRFDAKARVAAIREVLGPRPIARRLSRRGRSASAFPVGELRGDATCAGRLHLRAAAAATGCNRHIERVVLALAVMPEARCRRYSDRALKALQRFLHRRQCDESAAPAHARSQPAAAAPHAGAYPRWISGSALPPRSVGQGVRRDRFCTGMLGSIECAGSTFGQRSSGMLAEDRAQALAPAITSRSACSRAEMFNVPERRMANGMLYVALGPRAYARTTGAPAHRRANAPG